MKKSQSLFLKVFYHPIPQTSLDIILKFFLGPIELTRFDSSYCYFFQYSFFLIFFLGGKGSQFVRKRANREVPTIRQQVL